MPNVDNDKRETHIVRIFGTNESGERLDDTWLDIERIDRIETATQDTRNTQLIIPNQFQRQFYKIYWEKDIYDFEGTPFDENDARRRGDIVKVFDAESEDDPENPLEWIPVRTRLTTKFLTGGGSTGQGVEMFKKFFGKTDTGVERKVFNRRFYHYDTNFDDYVQNALENDPDIRKIVFDKDQVANYQRIEGSRDEEQFIETEIVEKLIRSDGTNWEEQRRGAQRTTWKMANDYYKDESDEASLKTVGIDGLNPPFRLDPFQVIINCNFGGGAVRFFDRRT